MKHRQTIGAILAAGLFAVGCGRVAVPGTSPAAAQPQALSVPAVTAQRGEIKQTLSFSGDVRAREQITVLPRPRVACRW